MFKKVKNYFLGKIKSLKRFQSQEKTLAERAERKEKKNALKILKEEQEKRKIETESFISKNVKVYPPINQSDKYHSIDEPWQEEY
jgi:hypothetical protein